MGSSRNGPAGEENPLSPSRPSPFGHSAFFLKKSRERKPGSACAEGRSASSFRTADGLPFRRAPEAVPLSAPGLDQGSHPFPRAPAFPPIRRVQQNARRPDLSVAVTCCGARKRLPVNIFRRKNCNTSDISHDFDKLSHPFPLSALTVSLLWANSGKKWQKVEQAWFSEEGIRAVSTRKAV